MKVAVRGLRKTYATRYQRARQRPDEEAHAQCKDAARGSG